MAVSKKYPKSENNIELSFLLNNLHYGYEYEYRHPCQAHPVSDRCYILPQAT